MRRFRFQLEPLARLRKQHEDQAMRTLGAAQRAYQAGQAYRRSLLAVLEHSLARREGLGAESAASRLDFALENDYISGTKQRIVQADQGILRAQRAVEKALRSYLLARKQTRIIEALREKQFAEFKRDLARRERRELDDLNVMRARFRHQERSA
jgi:flagellar export protein FliJ